MSEYESIGGKIVRLERTINDMMSEQEHMRNMATSPFWDRQGELVQRLQGKVIKYKQRCCELEDRLKDRGEETSSQTVKQMKEQLDYTEKTKKQMEEELRESRCKVKQLEETLNSREWTSREEQTRLMKTWNCISELKTELSHVKNSTERQVSEGKAQVGRTVANMSRFCESLKERTEELRRHGLTLMEKDKEKLREQLKKAETEWSRKEDDGRKERKEMEESLIKLCQTGKSDGRENRVYSEIANALSKQRNEIDDLRTKLSTFKEQNEDMSTKLNESMNNERGLNRRVTDLQTQVDSFKDQLKESAQVEIVRKNMNERMDSLTSEVEYFQRMSNELQKSQNYMEIELKDSVRQINRQTSENDRCHQLIDKLEQRNTNLREELLTLKESLNKQRLELDVLVDKKRHISSCLDKSEEERALMEGELRKVRTEKSRLEEERSDVYEEMEKLRIEKNKWNSYIQQLEGDRVKLMGDISQQECDKSELEKRLTCLGEERNKIEGDFSMCKMHLNHMMETKERLEGELATVLEEREELVDQWRMETKRNDSVSEELKTAKKELSKQEDNVERLRKEKEELTKTNGGLSEQLKSTEKEKQSLLESLNEVKVEKAALEGSVYELQQHCSSVESKKEQLEREKKELLARKEKLACQLDKAREEKECAVESGRRSLEELREASKEKERKLDLAIQLEKQRGEEEEERLRTERDNIKKEMECKIEETICHKSEEMSEMTKSNDKKIEQLRNELTKENQRIREMLEAENQQSTESLNQQICSLQDNVAFLKNELDQANDDLNRSKREGLSRQVYDQERIKGLEDSLKQSKSDSEEAQKKLTESMKTEMKEKNLKIEQVNRMNCDLKTEIDLMEQRISKIESEAAVLIKDNSELKMCIGTEVKEKESAIAVINELQGNVGELEMQKADLTRQLKDAQSTIHQNMANSERDMAELRESMKAERSRLCWEVSDINGKWMNAQENVQKCEKEINNKNNKLEELESVVDSLGRQVDLLQKRLTEVDGLVNNKNSEFDRVVEDFSRREDKLNRERQSLEKALDCAKQEMTGLRTNLTSSDGRIESLEGQLIKSNETRTQLENELNNICTQVKLSFGPSITNICSTIRDVSQKLSQTEKERMDFKEQAKYAKSCLKDAEEQRMSIESRLVRLQSTLSDIYKEKTRVESCLEEAHLAIAKQEESAKLASKQLRNYKDQLSEQRSSMKQLDHDKQILLEKLHIIQENECQTASEYQNLQQSIESSYAKSSQLSGSLQKAEDTLRRTKQCLNSKQDEIIELRKNLEYQKRANDELDMRNSDLQTTVDRMSATLSKLENENGLYKDRTAKLTSSSSECEVKLKCMQNRLENLQKTLIETEQARQTLQHKFDDTKSLLSQAKRDKSRVQAANNSNAVVLNNSEAKIAELENQLRLGQHRDEERVQSLQRALNNVEEHKRQLEVTIKNNMNEISSLRQSLTCREMMINQSNGRLEKENSHLREQINSLQRQLDQLETIQSQKMMSFVEGHRKDTQQELDRLLKVQSKAEKLLDTRDRVYKQRVSTLQEQVHLLKKELEREIRRKQSVETKRQSSAPHK